MVRWCLVCISTSHTPHKSGNVALIVDNVLSHGKELLDPHGQVEVLPLPLNVTSAHQTMDMGIIFAGKKSYREKCYVTWAFVLRRFHNVEKLTVRYELVCGV